MTISPDRATFHERAAAAPVVSVARTLLADALTPVGLYQALAGGPGTFLLESAEHGRQWSRWSFVGVSSLAVLSEVDGQAVWSGEVPAGLPTTGTPFDVLTETWRALRSPTYPGLPPLTAGLVGYLSYDLVRRFEKLPSKAVDDLHLPELGMLLVADLAALDHYEGTVVLVANAFLADGVDIDTAYDDALARLDAMTEKVEAGLTAGVSVKVAVEPTRPTGTLDDGAYEAAVEAAKEEIRSGECFQIVPSRRFDVPTTADALDVYRVLRTSNPSPYMYLVRLPGLNGDQKVDVVGSSPEALVTVRGGVARLRPIAGTYPRVGDAAKDAEAAAALLADPKERAEHVMLVDLGRNDLGRVCTPGTVEVQQFGQVEMFSHVIHIVSSVEGQVAPEFDAVDVLRACYPAGTLTGSPKVRAMEIIDELEPTRRGLYGGAVGYLDLAGDLDMAITIRTAVMRAGVAHVAAGAGVVAESHAPTEQAETRHKAAAVLRAVAVAQALRPV